VAMLGRMRAASSRHCRKSQATCHSPRIAGSGPTWMIMTTSTASTMMASKPSAKTNSCNKVTTTAPTAFIQDSTHFSTISKSRNSRRLPESKRSKPIYLFNPLFMFRFKNKQHKPTKEHLKFGISAVWNFNLEDKSEDQDQQDHH